MQSRGKKTPNWRLQGILNNIIASLERIEHYEAKHIYREANSEADSLPKIAAQETYMYRWDQGNLPIGLVDQVN